MPRTTTPPLIRYTVGLGLVAVVVCSAARADAWPSPSAIALARETATTVGSGTAVHPATVVSRQADAPWWQFWRLG